MNIREALFFMGNTACFALALILSVWDSRAAWLLAAPFIVLVIGSVLYGVSGTDILGFKPTKRHRR